MYQQFQLDCQEKDQTELIYGTLSGNTWEKRELPLVSFL